MNNDITLEELAAFMKTDVKGLEAFEEDELEENRDMLRREKEYQEQAKQLIPVFEKKLEADPLALYFEKHELGFWDGVRILAEFLKENTTVETLSLKENICGFLGLKAICELLSRNTTITELNLNHSRIRGLEIELLVDALQNNKTLCRLQLSWNDLPNDAPKHLEKALRDNISLTELDLMGCSIDSEGCSGLEALLKENKALKFLDLSLNEITSEGAKRIAGGLQMNNSLKSLNLSRNTCGDEGTIHLGNALKSNYSLKYLNLASNDIKNQGIAHLLECLIDHKSLHILLLDENHVNGGETLIENVKRFLSRNRAVQMLSLSANGIDDRVFSKIVKPAMKFNTHLNFLGLLFEERIWDKLFFRRNKDFQGSEKKAKYTFVGHRLNFETNADVSVILDE